MAGLLFHIRPLATIPPSQIKTFCGVYVALVLEERLDEHVTTEANVRESYPRRWHPGDSVCICCVRACIHDKFLTQEP